MPKTGLVRDGFCIYKMHERKVELHLGKPKSVMLGPKRFRITAFIQL